jgi:DNA-binding transcriptional MerR regulator
MFLIGTFGRLGGVSVRTLRHYEQVGVLCPASTDPATGYRYYEAEQLARLHRIQALQGLGLALHEIQAALEHELSADQLGEMLAEKQRQLNAQVARDQARLARVQQRLRYIAVEDDMSLEFVLRALPAERVAQVRHRGRHGLDFSSVREFSREARKVLDHALQTAAVRARGPAFVHYEERPDGTLDPAVAVAIYDQPLEPIASVETAELPGTDAVTTIYRGVGDHDFIGPVYGQMARYAADHGYIPHGPGRDQLLVRNGRQAVIGLHLPLRRSTS